MGSNIKTNRVYTPKKLVFLAVGLFMMFIFGNICPTWGAVTETGVKVLGVFLGWIIMMITGFGLMIPSLLSMFAMVLTGFYTSGTVLAGLGGNVPLLCLFAMILIYAFRSTKGDEVLMRYMITRPFLTGHPLRFLLVFNLAITFLSMFMDLGGMLLGFTFISAIANIAGYEKDSRFRRYMSMTTFVLCMCATNVTPAKGGSLLTIGAFSSGLAEAGFTMDLACYILTNMVAVVVFAIVLTFLAKPLFRVDLEPLKNIDVNRLVQDEENVRMNKRQISTLAIMIIGFGFPVVQMLFPAGSAIGVWMSGIGQVIFMVLLVAVMEIVVVGGAPLCRASEAFGKGVMWDVYLGIAAVVLLSGGLSNPDSGISAWITQIFGAAFSNMSFPVMLLVVVLLSGIVTQVFSNGATMVIVSSLLVPFVLPHAASGINVAVFPALIAQVCQMGCLTAAGSGFVPILLAEPGMHEKPNWIFFGGTVMLIVYCIIAIPVGILFGYAL